MDFTKGDSEFSSVAGVLGVVPFAVRFSYVFFVSGIWSVVKLPVYVGEDSTHLSVF